MTHRQRKLLQELALALQRKSIVLPLRSSFEPKQALRLYAALVSEAPRWSDDPLATGLIERLLQSITEIARAENHSQVLRLIQGGDLPAALGYVDSERQSSANAAFRFLISVFDDTPELVDQLEPAMQSPPASRREDSLLISDSVETDAAGAFLLVRALMDARATFWVPAVIGKGQFSAWLAELALRWSGVTPCDRRALDSGIRLFAGPGCPDSVAGVHRVLRTAPAGWQFAMQEKLLQILIGQRLLRGEVVHLFRLCATDGYHRLILGDASGQVWPLGRYFPPEHSPKTVVLEWLGKLEEQTGFVGAQVFADAALSTAIPLDVGAHFIDEMEAADDDVDAQRHLERRRRLVQSLEALGKGDMEPDVDLTLSLVADALLRVWARWLRKFSDSSTEYLLENFVRRSGSVSTDEFGLHVSMEAKPLDVVLEMAGYFDMIESVPWLENTQLRFER